MCEETGKYFCRRADILESIANVVLSMPFDDSYTKILQIISSLVTVLEGVLLYIYNLNNI